MIKKLVAILVAMLVLILAITGANSVFKHLDTSKAQHVSDNFLSSVVAGDSDSSFTLLTKATQSSITKPIWQTTVSRLHTTFQAQHAIPVTLRLLGNSQIAIYTLKGNDGDYSVTITLLKQGSWKVQSFDSKLVAT